jgi:hypothetical protein
MNMLSRTDYRAELAREARRLNEDEGVAERMAQVVRSGFAGIRTELMTLAREMSVDAVDQTEKQILANFGPDAAQINDILTDLLWHVSPALVRKLTAPKE